MMTIDPPPKTDCLAAPAAPPMRSVEGSRPPDRLMRWPAFRALLHRELRQAAPLIVIQWILALAGAVLVTYALVLLAYLWPNIGINILLYPPLLWVAGVYFPLCGLILGAAQGAADRGDDLWALLIHRPVPRWLQAAAKLAAGCILYLLGAGLPYAALGCFAATARGGALYLWPFLLPTLASALLGIVVYTAALASMARGVGGLGVLGWASRFFPLGVAGLAAWAVYTLPGFAQVCLVCAIAAFILALAAAGAVVSHGYRLTPPWWGRAALAATLIAGAAFPLAWLCDLAHNRIDNAQLALIRANAPPFVPEPDLLRNGVSIPTRFALLPDGRIIQQSPPDDMPDAPRTFTDLAGMPIESPTAWPLSFSLLRYWPNAYRGGIARYRDVGVGALPEPGPPRQTWYAFHGLWYGSTTKTHAALGTLGRNGFFPPHAGPALPFDGGFVESTDGHLLGYGLYSSDIYVVDFAARTVRLLFASPSGKPVLQVFETWSDWPRPAGHSGKMDIAVTADRLYFFDEPTGGVISEIPLDPPLTEAPIDLIPLPALHAWVIWHHMDRQWVIADYFDPAGKLLQSVQPGAQRAKAARLEEAAARDAWNARRRAAAAQPAALRGAAALRRADHYATLAAGALDGLQGETALWLRQRALTLNQPAAQTPPPAPPLRRLAMALITLLAAAATIALARRRRLPGPAAALWTAATLLTGPPAPLALLTTPRRPPPA